MSDAVDYELRAMLLQHSDFPDELRAKWASEEKQSAQPKKESIPVSTATSNFLSDLVSEQAEINERAVRKAKGEAEEAERIRVKALNDELKKHFSKLIDKSEGRIENGEFHFTFEGKKYHAFMSNGRFSLHGDGYSIGDFGVDGDAVTSLAKVLAKLKAVR